MSDFNVNMTFGDQWKAIKAGDIGTIIATAVELVILIITIAIIIAAFTN